MPLQALANPTVIVVAATYGVLLRIAVAAGLFGFLLGLLVSLSLGRYAYEVLRELARGRRELPPPGIESLNPAGDLSGILHFVLFAVAAAFFATTPFLDAPLRWLGGFFVLAVFPASAAIMALTSNAAAALSPAGIAHVMAVFGRGYWRLLAACALVAVIAAVARVLAGALGPLLVWLSDAIDAWAVLALFAVVGAAVRERRDDFAFPGIETEEERRERQRQTDWQSTLDRAYASIRSGLTAKGYATIKSLLESERDSLEIYQWTFNAMLSWEDRAHALEIAQRFVARLLEERREHDALELVRQCRRLSPAFSLPAERITALAAYAAASAVMARRTISSRARTPARPSGRAQSACSLPVISRAPRP